MQADSIFIARSIPAREKHEKSRDVASPQFIDRFALLDRLLAWPRQAVLRVGDAGVGRRTLTQLVCHTSPGAGPLGAQLLDDATALVHSHDIPSFYAPDEMELLKQTLKDALEDGHTDGAKLVAALQGCSIGLSPCHSPARSLPPSRLPGCRGTWGSTRGCTPPTQPASCALRRSHSSILRRASCLLSTSLSLRAHVLSLADGEWAFSSLRSIADARLARLSRRALRPPPTHSVPTEAASGAAHLHERRAATLLSLALAIHTQQQHAGLT